MIHANKVFFIVGPTAIGKTRLSLKLTKRINGEIISCDSMQIYKGMAILSQAPTNKDRKMVRHHLVQVLDPRQEYNAAIFKEKAARIISSIIKCGKVPIVVGGSGLYVKALIDGLFPSPPADLKFRKRMENIVASYGSKKLYDKLTEIDSEAAKNIHPNERYRCRSQHSVRNN